jgi:uncharacterized protein (DUF488 family)
MAGRIFTIGHGTWMLDGMIQMLRAHGVSHLLDIRTSPHSSYQPEFSRPALEKAADRKGFIYVYMGDQLGGRPNQADCYTESTVDYSKLRQKDFFKRGIARLLESREQDLTVCLLCAEGRPTECHRALLVGRALTDAGVLVEHLLPNGTIQTQAQVLAEPPTAQLGLGL